MPPRPKVSVVIPTYNAQDFILEQLDALMAGSRLPDEIIVSNNGSRDQTLALLEAYQLSCPRLRIVDSSAQQGVNYARNLGVAAALGQYILICDADDRVERDWLERMAAGLEGADLVGSGHRKLVYEPETASYRLGELVTEQPEVLAGKPYLLGASMGFRREVFDTISGFDCSYRGGHDEVDFCLRALRAGYQMEWIPAALIAYRQRPHQASRGRQIRSYGRTWIQLGQNFSEDFRGQQPPVRRLVRQLAGAAAPLISRRAEEGDYQGFWWNLGRLEGALRYQVLRQQPARQLYDPYETEN